MSKSSFSKRLLSSLASIGLVAGLIGTSAPSAVSAASGPFYPDIELRIPFNQFDGDFEILNGQELELKIYVSLSAPWAGWADNPSSFSAANFAPSGLPSGVSITDSSFTWSYSSSTNSSCSGYVPSTSGTISQSYAGLACLADINYLNFTGTWVINNSSGDDQTIDTDFETASMIVGADSVNDDVTGVSFNAMTFLAETLTASGIVIPANSDGNANLSWYNFCYEDSVEVGDVVDVIRYITVADGGIQTPVSGVMSDSEPYYDDMTFSESTHEITSPDLTSYRVTADWYFYDNENDTVGMTLRASLDLTADGVSVITDDCGGGGSPDPTYPTVGEMPGGNRAGNGAISSLKNLPAGIPDIAWENDNFSTEGPNGDVFYGGLASSSSVVVSHLGPKGSLNIGGSAKLTQTIPDGSTIASFAWYGGARDKYALVTRGGGMNADYKFYFGNIANSRGKSVKTLTSAKLNGASGICKTAGLTGDVYPISANTRSLIVRVRCWSMMSPSDAFFVWGKIANEGAAGLKIISLGVATPTEAKPCQYNGFGINASAKGTGVALIIYSSIGEETDVTMPGGGMSFPDCAGAEASNRSFITVSARGTSKKQALSGAVFGSTEPEFLELAAGTTPGSWIGFTVNYTTYAGLSIGRGYTISKTGAVTQKASPRTPEVAGSFDAGSPEDGVVDIFTPIKVLRSGKWLVARNQDNYSGETSVIAIATYNPSSGAIVHGEPLVLSDFFWPDWFTINVAATSLAGAMNYYVSPEPGKYQVATWKNFTR